MNEKEKKPDKLALKNKLYADKIDLAQRIIDTDNLLEKKYLRVAFDIVNSYIEICLKRNKI